MPIGNWEDIEVESAGPNTETTFHDSIVEDHLTVNSYRK
jgi:hypothetical protein